MDFKIDRRSALKAGAALAASGIVPAWAQDKPKLRFAAVFSDKDIRADMMKIFAKEIEADYTVETFLGGDLFKQGTELVALQRDNLELGNIVPEIMIPLVGEKRELKFVKDIVVETAEAVKKEMRFRYRIPYWYNDRNSSCSFTC